jgi:hypothetical protein
MPFEVKDQRGVSASPHFFEGLSFSSQVFVLFIALNFAVTLYFIFCLSLIFSLQSI